MAEAYGIDKVNILLLDDSNDDTVLEVEKVVNEYKKQHFHIEIVHRPNRQGFKAGALQAAIEKTPEDFVAIFDADFMPPADFLVRTLPYFFQDEAIGIVQSRWGHLNRDTNLITRATAIAIDIHFMIEQAGRYAAGLFQNFNGSSGVIRKKAILEAGGWHSDTLAEDLDLSYRMQLLGYRVVYLNDLVSPGEIPPTLPSYKKQQGRWANGSLRTAKKNLPRLLSKQEIGFGKRLQAFIHMTGYSLHSLMTMSFLLSCMIAIFTLSSPGLPRGIAGSVTPVTVNSMQNLVWFFLSPLIFLCMIGPWISAIITLRVQRLSFSKNLINLMVLLLLGFGISLNNTLEVGKGLFSNRGWEFVRTPKYADLQDKESWRAKKYQINLDAMWGVELFFACLGIFAISHAIQHSNFSVLSMLIPFTMAYIAVALFTVLQSRIKKTI